jgi:hypothetical protein
MSSNNFNKNKFGNIDNKNLQIHGNMDQGNSRSLARKHLKKAFGNMVIPGLGTSPSTYPKNILGPFRTSFNSGDVITNTTENTNIKYGRSANQINGNNVARISVARDGVSHGGNAMYSGNPKFIHDGSDYIKFKRLQAILKNSQKTV